MKGERGGRRLFWRCWKNLQAFLRAATPHSVWTLCSAATSSFQNRQLVCTYELVFVQANYWTINISNSFIHKQRLSQMFVTQDFLYVHGSNASYLICCVHLSVCSYSEWIWIFWILIQSIKYNSGPKWTMWTMFHSFHYEFLNWGSGMPS